MNNNQNQPREFDVVLGGKNPPPVTGVVLGGIEGVKRKLANPEIKVKIAGLYQALNYGDAGLDLIIEALHLCLLLHLFVMDKHRVNFF